MRDHRYHTTSDKLIEHLADRWLNAKVGKFNQQVFEAVDGVLPWMGKLVLDIVIGEMKVAAQAESDASGRILHDRRELLPVDLRGERPAVVGVRSADNVRDIVGDGKIDHRAGRLQVSGAVVKSEEEVMMNIDHDRGVRLRRPGPPPPRLGPSTQK